MKKIVLLLMALMTMGTAQESAAQRLTATVKKKPTMQKTIIAGKTTAPKKQTLANAATVTITDPVIVNGHVAFLGVPVKQAENAIKKQLLAKGLADPNENGFKYLGGTAYDVKVKVFIEDENRITVREAKGYTKSQVKARINAYKKAFVEATGAKATEECMDCDDGGVKIETTGGLIDIHFYNQDEVNFSSKYFDIVLTFSQY